MSDEKSRAHNANDGIPRRARIDKMTAAERTIFAATVLIELLPADERLTKAQTLLSQARDLVADYVDSP